MTVVLLEARKITKAFPGVKALDDVSMTVHAGEILALVGHNGSGKSTLVKILAGVYQPDSGTVVTVGGTSKRGHESLHFIHQDLGLVPTLTTIENIDLSRSHGLRAVLPSPARAERKRARTLITEFGVRFDVDVPVSRLTPAERTIVAIARALDGWTSSANVLVLDEPTAALQGEEVGKLFAAVRKVVLAGAGVVIVSHRLAEVVELADRVIVLRDGCVAGAHSRGEFDQASLVRLIAGASDGGRELLDDADLGAVRLSVRGLHSVHLRGVDLDVRAGEIVGVTGLLGSGTEQLAGTVFGAVACTSGAVTVDGRPVPSGSPSGAIACGMGYVPADRRRFGAVLTMSAKENLTLPRLAPLRAGFGRIDLGLERREANSWMQNVGVRPTDAGDRSFTLFSGGNQQKIMIAKWLRIEPTVLLLDEPTQGVDVAAQASIHSLVARVAAGGAAVLVSSTDTKELVALCDRVLVLHDGRVARTLEGAELTEPALVAATVDIPAGSAATSEVMHHGGRNG